MTDPSPRTTGPAGEDTDENDADDGPDQSGATARERRTVPAGAFVLAVMAAMALGVLAVVALTMGSDGGDDDQDIRLAAGRFAERFLTFEHDAIDEWKSDVLRLSTGGFAEEVEDVESGLRRLIAESELDARTEVTDVFVGQVERGSVGVVVVYDRSIEGTSGVRSEDDRYMQLSLVRVDGEWLVDTVIDIATAGGAGLPAGGPENEGGGSSATTGG